MNDIYATKTPRTCPVCRNCGEIKYQENIDLSRINSFTYSSRKVPELMHYEYRECRECELLFTSQIPAHEDLLDSYEQAGFDAARESKFAAQTYIQTLKKAITEKINSVLDVGCGDGEFIKACLKTGIHRVQGIEPSLAAMSVAEPGIQERIFVGGYETYSVEEQFDVVTLFQTIEHIREPVDFLTKAKEFVRPGGYIAIACHDYKSIANRMLGKKSPIFDIEHLQIFSKHSIAKAMASAGLKNVSVTPYRNVYPISYWARLSPIPTRLKEGAILGGSWANAISLGLPVGNVLALGKNH